MQQYGDKYQTTPRYVWFEPPSDIRYNPTAPTASTTMVLPPLAFALYAFATCLALTSADETPVGSLYAYGANISGLPLFYGDGQYFPQTTTSNPASD
jgi:hypothetical protein